MEATQSCAQTFRQTGARWDTIRAVFSNGIDNHPWDYETTGSASNFIYTDSVRKNFTAIWHNVRGMELNLPDIIHREYDLQLLSECSIPEYLTKQVSDDCNEANNKCHFGQCGDLSKHEGKRRGRRVAALVRRYNDKSISIHPPCVSQWHW